MDRLEEADSMLCAALKELEQTLHDRNSNCISSLSTCNKSSSSSSSRMEQPNVFSQTNEPNANTKLFNSLSQLENISKWINGNMDTDVMNTRKPMHDHIEDLESIHDNVVKEIRKIYHKLTLQRKDMDILKDMMYENREEIMRIQQSLNNVYDEDVRAELQSRRVDLLAKMSSLNLSYVNMERECSSDEIRLNYLQERERKTSLDLQRNMQMLNRNSGSIRSDFDLQSQNGYQSSDEYGWNTAKGRLYQEKKDHARYSSQGRLVGINTTPTHKSSLHSLPCTPLSNEHSRSSLSANSQSNLNIDVEEARIPKSLTHEMVAPQASTSTLQSGREHANDQYEGNEASSTLMNSKRTRSAPDLAKLATKSKSSESGEKLRNYTKEDVRTLKRELTRLSLRNILAPRSRSSTCKKSGSISERLSTISSPEVRSIRSDSRSRVHYFPSLSKFLAYNYDDMIEWMKLIGFGQYTPRIHDNIRNARHLLNISGLEMERYLNIRNPLHRKRFNIILRSINYDKEPANSHWDLYQTLSWLELIGLPQYKESFAESYIDGPVLTQLTGADLLKLRVHNAQHFHTIQWSLRHLNNHQFNITCLDQHVQPVSICLTADHVIRWSHSATCEWLRSIDLEEFIPNMLCAGMPGALMVCEPSFTAESLAEVLKIPVSKSLLRRHITLHFNQLVGQQIVSDKRSYLATNKHPRLNPTLRVKESKRRFPLSFTAKKDVVFVDLEQQLIPEAKL